MKYAVIQTSGSQFKVKEGDSLNLDKIEGKPKKKLTFTEVLLVVSDKTVKIGQPLVKGAKVTAQIIKQFKDKKIRVVKFKAKSRYRKVQGHRQPLTQVKINKITTGSI